MVAASGTAIMQKTLPSDLFSYLLVNIFRLTGALKPSSFLMVLTKVRNELKRSKTTLNDLKPSKTT